MVLTSYPQLETVGIKVGIVSGERLIESREDRSIINKRVCQYHTGVKGIPFEMSYSLTLVSLLQLYIVLTSGTIQHIYLCRAVFLKFLLLT